VLHAWVNDSFGNLNYTNVTFTIDTLGPVINIISPEAKTHIASDILLDIDTDEETYSCYYNLDSGGDVEMNKLDGMNFDYSLTGLSNGQHSVTFSCYDLLNNFGSKSVNFAIDTIPPAISLISPADDLGLNYQENIQFNYTPVEEDNSLGVCQLWGNWVGGWHLNYTENSPLNCSINTINLNISDGVYEWSVWSDNSLGVGDWSTQSNFSFVVDTTLPELTGLTTSENFPLTNNGNAQSVSVNFVSSEYPINVTFNLYNSSLKIVNTQSSILNSASDLPVVYNILGTLADGTYSLNMTIADSLGNNLTIALGEIVVDTSGSSIVIHSPSGSYSSTAVNLEVTGDSGIDS